MDNSSLKTAKATFYLLRTVNCLVNKKNNRNIENYNKESGELWDKIKNDVKRYLEMEDKSTSIIYKNSVFYRSYTVIKSEENN